VDRDPLADVRPALRRNNDHRTDEDRRRSRDHGRLLVRGHAVKRQRTSEPGEQMANDLAKHDLENFYVVHSFETTLRIELKIVGGGPISADSEGLKVGSLLTVSSFVG
jgi:hypothetical protein